MTGYTGLQKWQILIPTWNSVSAWLIDRLWISSRKKNGIKTQTLVFWRPLEVTDIWRSQPSWRKKSWIWQLRYLLQAIHCGNSNKGNLQSWQRFCRDWCEKRVWCWKVELTLDCLMTTGDLIVSVCAIPGHHPSHLWSSERTVGKHWTQMVCFRDWAESFALLWLSKKGTSIRLRQATCIFKKMSFQRWPAEEDYRLCMILCSEISHHIHPNPAGH